MFPLFIVVRYIQLCKYGFGVAFQIPSVCGVHSVIKGVKIFLRLRRTGQFGLTDSLLILLYELYRGIVAVENLSENGVIGIVFRSLWQIADSQTIFSYDLTAVGSLPFRPLF